MLFGTPRQKTSSSASSMMRTIGRPLASPREKLRRAESGEASRNWVSISPGCSTMKRGRGRGREDPSDDVRLAGAGRARELRPHAPTRIGRVDVAHHVIDGLEHGRAVVLADARVGRPLQVVRTPGLRSSVVACAGRPVRPSLAGRIQAARSPRGAARADLRRGSGRERVSLRKSKVDLREPAVRDERHRGASAVVAQDAKPERTKAGRERRSRRPATRRTAPAGSIVAAYRAGVKGQLDRGEIGKATTQQWPLGPEPRGVSCAPSARGARGAPASGQRCSRSCQARTVGGQRRRVGRRGAVVDVDRRSHEVWVPRLPASCVDSKA